MRRIRVYIAKKKDFLGYNQSDLGYKLLEYGLRGSFSKDDIEKGKCGKPYFKDNRLYFNISHSKNYVACAIYDREIGLDIEEDRKINKKALEKIINREDRGMEPIRIWNIKESYSKYLGIGLRLDFSSISILDIKKECFLIYDKIEDLYISICTNKTGDFSIEFLEIGIF